MANTKRNIEESFACSPMGFSSTTDHWTCQWTNVCSSSFTIHYVTKDWTLLNHLLALKRYPSKKPDGTNMTKTAKEQATEIKCIIESLTVIGENPLTFVTDSEPVQIKTIHELNYPHLPCLAHRLNTVLQTFFDASKNYCPKSIVNTVKSCKGIVTHYKQGFHMDLLDTTLKQNGETRWNSHLAMFKSIIKNWDSLEKTADQVDNRSEDIRSLLDQLRLEEVKGIIMILEVW